MKMNGCAIYNRGLRSILLFYEIKKKIVVR